VTAVLLGSADLVEHVVQHPLVRVGGVTLLSNHIVMQIIVAALLAALVPRALRPRGRDETGRLLPANLFGHAIEWVCLLIRKYIAEPALGAHTDRFITYLWTLFFFILFSNLLGMVPLDPWNGPLFGRHVIGGTATSNIWVTGTLAMCTFVLIVYEGLKAHGFGYLKHFFLVGPWWMAWLLGPLEILSLFVRTFALTVRLWANMVAGHLILAVLHVFTIGAAAWLGAGLLATIGGLVLIALLIGGSLFVHLLEVLLVAPLQAVIFTTLTAVFIGQAINIGQDAHAQTAEPPGAAALAAARH